MASGSGDSTFRLWDLETYQCVRSFTEHNNWVYSVAFSPNGKFLASGGGDSTIRLWDLKTLQCIYVLSEHSNRVRTVAFNPESNILASASIDGTIRLWEVKTGNCFAILQTPRPYEETDITGAMGLTRAQRASMIALGAVDHSSES